MAFGFFALSGALTLLLSPAQIDAAMGGASVGDKGVIEPVHYSKHYERRRGLLKCYGHEHKEGCRRACGYWGDNEESRYEAWRWRFGAGGRPVEN